MKTITIAYAVTLAAFVVVDAVWLSRMASVLYRPVMGDMLLERFRVAPAVVFYFVYAAGLVFFAVRPALAAQDWQTALVHGALVGGFAYATYNLTNHATLKNWSTPLTAADMTWGATVSGIAALAGYLAASYAAR